MLIKILLLAALSANAQQDSPGHGCTLKTTFDSAGVCTIFGDAIKASSAYSVTGSSVPTVSGVSKVKTTSNQVFYSSAAAPVNLGSNITGLSFSLAGSTSYYFEFDINHTSTATATGVWFGMTYPSGSTITYTVSQAIGLASYTLSMSRGAEFVTAAGATVDAVDSACPAKVYGTISTLGGGTLQMRVKSELQNGRGSVLAGSSGTLIEQ